MTKLIDRKIVFVRYHLRVDDIVVCRFQTYDIVDNSIDILCRAVTKWVNQTEEGKNIYEYSSEDLNIGDISGCSEGTFSQWGVYNFVVESIDMDRGEQCDYDKHLYVGDFNNEDEKDDLNTLNLALLDNKYWSHKEVEIVELGLGYSLKHDPLRDRYKWTPLCSDGRLFDTANYKDAVDQLKKHYSENKIEI